MQVELWCGLKAKLRGEEMTLRGDRLAVTRKLVLTIYSADDLLSYMTTFWQGGASMMSSTLKVSVSVMMGLKSSMDCMKWWFS